jgi:selenocysteine lyase/cysteine desulfurase
MGEVATRWRAQFPLLETCCYLNSNSTGAVPRAVKAVLDEYARTLFHWRDEVWEGWWRELHAYADELAGFIGGAPGSVVTDASLSSLLGRLGTCFDWRVRPRIVITDLEFPTVPFLWKAFARWGAELITVPVAGSADPEARLVSAIDERTQLVCVSHAAYATGALLDVKQVARAAHERGALIAVDAYQSVGCVPVDVRDLGVDFLLGGAHKWMCGSIESGFLYVRPELVHDLEPVATGWMASDDPLSFRPAHRYAAGARRFASGTPQVLPALVSRVGLGILAQVGIHAIRERSLLLTQRLIARADGAGLELVTPREPWRRAGVVALRFPGAEAVAAELVRRGFVCSHRGALRVAPHFYNSDEEVEQFMDVLVELARTVDR